jgi:hypothetical protein
MTATPRRTSRVLLGVAGFAATALATAMVPPPTEALPPRSALLLTAALQAAMFAINFTVAIEALRRRPQSIDDTDVASTAVGRLRPVSPS